MDNSWTFVFFPEERYEKNYSVYSKFFVYLQFIVGFGFMKKSLILFF